MTVNVYEHSQPNGTLRTIYGGLTHDQWVLPSSVVVDGATLWEFFLSDRRIPKTSLYDVLFKFEWFAKWDRSLMERDKRWYDRVMLFLMGVVLRVQYRKTPRISKEARKGLFDNPQDLADYLVRLNSLGYRCPEEVIDYVRGLS